MVGDAVDGSGRDVDHPLHVFSQRLFQHDPGAVHLGGEYVGRSVQRQGRRRVDDNVHVLQRGVHRLRVADIARDCSYTAYHVRVVERRDVQRRHALSPLQQVADQIDAQESGAAGDEVGFRRMAHTTFSNDCRATASA